MNGNGQTQISLAANLNTPKVSPSPISREAASLSITVVPRTATPTSYHHITLPLYTIVAACHGWKNKRNLSSFSSQIIGFLPSSSASTTQEQQRCHRGPARVRPRLLFVTALMSRVASCIADNLLFSICFLNGNHRDKTVGGHSSIFATRLPYILLFISVVRMNLCIG